MQISQSLLYKFFIVFLRLYSNVEVNFDFGDTSRDNHCYIYNPNATINGCFYGTVHGFAGSTAEAFAKENGYNFVNMGSDYSAELGDIESAVDHILELDNALLGGDAL